MVGLVGWFLQSEATVCLCLLKLFDVAHLWSGPLQQAFAHTLDGKVLHVHPSEH